jgi:tetratricopeptide (TPR) repeat protein
MPQEYLPDNPIPLDSKGKRVSPEREENDLLSLLAHHERKVEETILDLALLNLRLERQEQANVYLNKLLARTEDPEKKASYLLTLGCSLEQIQNYQEAIIYYTQALSLEPANNVTWYFINNNLGYCLNHFKKYGEAEPYCRAAIMIDPWQYNAYKNLGISMEGQGKYPEAAVLYIKAVNRNAKDLRALAHLEELVATHEAIKYDIPDIQDQIEKCRVAVKLAERNQSGNKDN